MPLGFISDAFSRIGDRVFEPVAGATANVVRGVGHFTADMATAAGRFAAAGIEQRSAVMGVVGGFAVAVALGGGLARSLPVRVPVEVATRPSVAAAVTNGRDYMVEAAFVPVAIVKSGAGEVIDYQLELAPKDPLDMRIAYSVTLFDDRGHELRGLRKETMSVGRAAVAGGGAFRPSGLADGFYRMEALIAATSSERQMAQRLSHYLEVRAGQMNEITLDDYMARSHARESVPLATKGGAR